MGHSGSNAFVSLIRNGVIAGCILGITMGSAYAVEDTADLARQLAELKAMIQQQQAEIQQLRDQVREQNTTVSREISDEVDAAIAAGSYAQMKETAPVVTLGHSNISGLKLKGDLRMRFDRMERDLNRDNPANSAFTPGYEDEARDRFRTRLRLGGVWTNPAESWEIGVGFATGGNAGTSTNDTWSDGAVFETGDLRLDYAYAKHTLLDSEDTNITLTIGQQKRPFVSGNVMWDGDLRPAGATLQVTSGPVFLTIGAYDIVNLDHINDEAIAALYAAQIGYDGKLNDTVTLTLATSYYHYSDPFTNQSDTSRNPLVTGINPDQEYHIADLYAELGTKAGDFSLNGWVHAWKNFAATGSPGQSSVINEGDSSTVAGVDGANTIDPSDNDIGYSLGIKAAYDAFSIFYMYGHVEADSIYGGVTNSDWGAGAGVPNTDIEGHQLTLGYKVTKHFQLAATAIMLKEIDGFNADGAVYELDALYTF